MVKVLEINNLNYHDFKSINMSFENNSFYSIIGGNNSGKTTLFKLMTGFISTTNVISCDGIILNINSTNKYIQKIGIVERINKDSFIFQKVLDEMEYPLYNLGYSKKKRNTRIKEVLKHFDLEDVLDKNINELDYYTKQILLIMLSLLHNPKVLLLDNVLNVFSKYQRTNINNLLKKWMNKKKMTIISFVPDLMDYLDSDKLILLSNFQILGEYLPSDIYQDDKKFYQEGLEIPFMVDLSVKLRMYDVINKNYSDMKEMVDNIWP